MTVCMCVCVRVCVFMYIYMQVMFATGRNPRTDGLNCDKVCLWQTNVQHITPHSSTLRHAATHFAILQHTATHLWQGMSVSCVCVSLFLCKRCCNIWDVILCFVGVSVHASMPICVRVCVHVCASVPVCVRVCACWRRCCVRNNAVVLTHCLCSHASNGRCGGFD